MQFENNWKATDWVHKSEVDRGLRTSAARALWLKHVRAYLALTKKDSRSIDFCGSFLI